MSNTRLVPMNLTPRVVSAVLTVALCPILMAASCKKKEPEGPVADPREVVAAADKAGGSAVTPVAAAKPAAPVDTTPIAGIETGKLSATQSQSFFKLADSLQSPCGKAHSLRASIQTDPTCVRGPFAGKYLLALIEEGATEEQAKAEYENHYQNPRKSYTFSLSPPLSGTAGAPLVLVEFFDYACPHCARFAPILDEVVKKLGSKVVLYYKNFPLNHNPDSPMAARAALAANAQGRFSEMHHMLFSSVGKHKRADVVGYAKSLGLDVGKFEKDLDAAAARVEADKGEGNAAEVDGTPRLYVNGKAYDGPMHPVFLTLWLEEELAVLDAAKAAQ